MNPAEDLELSESQRAALLDGRSRVLVAAGAGSGKTRLLVAYFIDALVNEGLPLEQLVAVTFTRKAAAELVSRIRSSLRDCGRSDLARSLDTATIGTIHSLCRRLLRERALEAGVDPAFTVLEAEAAALVKEEVCGQAWAGAIEEADEVELEVLASQGDALRKEIIPLYDRLRGAGQERPRMAVDPGASEEQARSALARLVGETLAAGNAQARRSASLESDLLSLEGCLIWLETSRMVTGRDDDLCSTEAFFPSRRSPSMEPYFGPVRTALTLFRRCLAETRLRPVVSTMNGLLARFDHHYEAYKSERSLLDFTDLELRARALLGDSGGGAPSALPPASRIMIDEFQDTNELQCAIIEGLGAARLLMVGDERQSIYRFRGADVEVFRRREALLAPQIAGTERGALHRLDVNYRSRPEVLAFINRLFAHERFFGARFVALEHGRDEEKNAITPAVDRPAAAGGARATGPAQPAIEVLVVERVEKADPDGRAPLLQEAEAHAVAARVRQLLDDEGWDPRHIVVLTPAQTHVVLYQQALLAHGVDVYVVGGKGYYSREEVSDVTALLRLLVNPHDDLALVAVLRSPLVGLSDDGLYLLGREVRRTRARSLWEIARRGEEFGLDDADRQLMRDLVARLAKLRRAVGRPGLARLIDDAVSDCGYDLCLLASAEGKRRFANVRKLMRMADDFEALQGPDLAGFVAVIQSLGDLSDREGSAPTLAEGENVVRVMTVHQAKGLEFPVVVLAGLGSDVPRGARSEFIVGDDGRMGAFLKGSQRGNYESHDLCWGPAAEVVADERVREQEEDVRLLYVAMTRAQERLVLVGARPGGDKAENCRIGRIVLGLGLEALPPAGGTIFLDGLDAVVAGILPVAANAEKMPRSDGDAGSSSAKRAAGVCPQFPEYVSAGIALRRISFSALAAHQRCPRRFYLERVLGLKLAVDAPAVVPPATAAEDTLPDESEMHAGREVGLLVHALLERSALDQERPAPDSLRHATLEWLSATGSHLSEADMERALQLTLAFWRSPFAGGRPLAHAAREAPFFFTQGDTLITGVMDLMWEEGGVWHIVDYKTNALNGRPVAEMAAGYELQAAVYSLAALRAGAQSVRMHLLFLEEAEKPVTLSFDTDDHAYLGTMIDQALGDMGQATFPVRTGEDCSRCSVAEVCAHMARP
jgi:ATP-dependent helicase/nuclease subunit A